MPQPIASDTRYAATSRRVSVPIGKSNSGRSPIVGFQTASRSPSASSPPKASGAVPPGQTRTTIALFDEPTSRPMTSSSPSRSRSTSARSRLRAGASGAPVGAGSGSVDVVAVLARADVAGRIERVAAQRARRPPRTGSRGRPARRRSVRASAVSRTRSRSGPSSSSSSISSRPSASASSSASRLGARLDQDPLGVAVPAEGQRVARNASFRGSSSGLLVGLDRGRRVLDDAAPVELDEEAGRGAPPAPRPGPSRGRR